MEKLQTILLVDDDESYRWMLHSGLERMGFRVLDADDGLRGLSILRSGDELPDLIITDVRMDGMDGLTFAKEIRADARFDRIPVLICSGDFIGDNATGIRNVLSSEKDINHIIGLVGTELEVPLPTH